MHHWGFWESKGDGGPAKQRSQESSSNLWNVVVYGIFIAFTSSQKKSHPLCKQEDRGGAKVVQGLSLTCPKCCDNTVRGGRRSSGTQQSGDWAQKLLEICGPVSQKVRWGLPDGQSDGHRQLQNSNCSSIKSSVQGGANKHWTIRLN